MTTARLIVTTQYYENYGAHTWDGKGECPQYWKPKGGSEYLIAEITLDEAVRGEAYLKSLVNTAAPSIEANDDYNHEYIIGWGLYWDDELTADEEMCKGFGNDYSNAVCDIRNKLKAA